MRQRRGILGRIRDLLATPASWLVGSSVANSPAAIVDGCACAADPTDELPSLDLDRMLWMLDGVLEQAHSKPSPARAERVDVRALLDDIVAQCDPELISVAPTSWPVHVLAEPPEVRRVFSILIARALADSTRTVIRLDRGTSAMVVHFDDNGPGVAREARDDLFVFSADRHPAENALAAAWQKASSLGGDIRVSSSPEGGARFTVRLPTLCETHVAFASAS